LDTLHPAKRGEGEKMSAFEYVMVPVSIVFAMALGKVLVAIMSSIQSGKQNWIHLLWCMAILLGAIGQWTMFWKLNSNEVWTAPEFLLTLIAPIILYSAAHILVTDNPDAIEDWSEHLQQSFRLLSVLMLSTFPIFVLRTYLILDTVIFPASVIPIAAMTLFAWFRPARWVLATLAVLWLLPFVATMDGTFTSQ
jgi:hypothetical protein